MEIPIDPAEPATKRRKLSPELVERLPRPFSNYVCVARNEVPIGVEPYFLAQLRSSLTDDAVVSLKKINRDETNFHLHVILENKKKLSTVAWPSKGNAAASDPQQVLDNSIKIEPASRYNIESLKLPLACSHYRLHLIDSQLFLEIRILWQDTVYLRDKVDPLLSDILRKYLPECGSQASLVPEVWGPREFYDNVHVPSKTTEDSAEINIDLLESQLYPFQRRTVKWMLSREGVTINAPAQLDKVQSLDGGALPSGFSLNRDAFGGVCYVHHAVGVVSTSFADVQEKYQDVTGGLLADEMGLGKTLAVISTICLHKRPDINCNPVDGQLRRSGATLIITPPTILEQWKQEIQEHSPSLKVVHYEGIKPLKQNVEEVANLLAGSDIVLTTYNVIAKEVHYVAEKPDRQLRHRPRADPPKSPLTQISWWRVCLDEAQMVESGISNAATVARLIPRINAWAVTGTPLRKGHQDLYGLLLFLRMLPWSYSSRLWDHLITYHRPMFRAMIGRIAIRHSKSFVREELRLPQQSRHTITLPFTAVEEQHYSQMFTEMCDAIELNRDGAPLQGEWDPDDPSTIEKMRHWLTRLRQTCLHPEVGIRNRRALGRVAGPLRTVEEVLDVMIEQNESLIRSEQRNQLLARIRQGQMQENAKATDQALELWKNAYAESCTIVEECRKQLEQEIAAQRTSGIKSAPESDSDDNEDENDTDTRLQMFRQRLRSALEVQHICVFFMANAYFQLKSDEDKIQPDSDAFLNFEKLETGAYDEAKTIRGELLKEVMRKANRFITRIRLTVTGATIPQMHAPGDYIGIESRKIFDKLYDYCEVMNTHKVYFEEIRKKMTDFLQSALIDEDEGVELQGDEYESSTKHQDEMYAYMEALRALFADRSDAISGQENLLIRQEMKQFLRSAKEGEGPAPELMLKLLAEREQKRIKVAEQGSLRGILAEIRQLVTALQWQEAGGSVRARTELTIANKVLQQVQELANVQTKSLSALEQEVNLFRDTMNSRLDYYRALQKISDTVAPYDEEHVGQPVDAYRYGGLVKQEEELTAKISKMTSKHRYLIHLKNESAGQSQRTCIICQSDFELGTLTVCGHQFCKECIQLWWNEHRNCPVCKRRLHIHDFHDITYKPAAIAVQADSSQEDRVSSSPVKDTDKAPNQSIYSDIGTTTLNQIKNVDLQGGSFGSKVDMLSRHILWLREHDPGTKAIVFSQYREFLSVLGRAFSQHKISHTAFDDKNGTERFKHDPAIECFLLHAKAHSAGLNLVVANHVFLCEPLLNTAIELQAIARVHRIGQHRATTVWMYVIDGSVEESIYDISVARRLAHIKRAVNKKGKGKLNSQSASGTSTPQNSVGVQETAIDAANSLELQAADLSRLLTSGKTGGELVDKEDLWQCLFGKVKKREAVVVGSQRQQNAESGMDRFLRAEAAEAAEARNLEIR